MMYMTVLFNGFFNNITRTMYETGAALGKLLWSGGCTSPRHAIARCPLSLPRLRVMSLHMFAADDRG